MDEEEFLRLIVPLRHKRAAHLAKMNNAPAGSEKFMRHQRLSEEALRAIDKVTKQYEFGQEQEKWKQRLADKLAEGAHPDVIIYCEDRISTWNAPDDSGDTFIEIPDGKRFRQSGDRLIRLPDRDASQANPWIEYHDALVQEWFDGEKALIADLYPSAPRPARKSQHPSRELADLRRKVLPHNIYTYTTLANIACVGFQLLGGHIFAAIIWATMAAINYALALGKAKRP